MSYLDGKKEKSSVADYFVRQLGISARRAGDDTGLDQCPLQDACGSDCKRVIDAAAKMIAVCDESVHKEIVTVALHAVQVFWVG